ncbi:interferon alpha-1-like [Meriones unguiculatus]|uniref:interferon alpha-1-like n=1 Tax=Meriones unguiculatus TaxID=10047 RepID=UPI00293EA008|nr:interferon alpha-1-like [Meriones unguiculatus]
MPPPPPQTLLLVGGGAAAGPKHRLLPRLGSLKSVPAHRCLRDRTDFRRLWKQGAGAREERQEATCCYPEVLRQVLHLFVAEASRDAWPQKALEQLLTNVHSDLRDTQQGPAQQGPSCPPPFLTDICKYFRRISSYLKAKGYSPCSWEIVRTEMQAALSGFPGPAERSPEKSRGSLEGSPLR